MLSEEKSAFIRFMIDAGALSFGCFVTKSGRNSPYFINTGEYKTGEQLSKLGDFYAELIKNSLDIANEEFTVLFGPAYKGIPLVTAAASKLAEQGLNYKVSFDRKERKGHGEGSMILGYLPNNGERIAIVEDVTTAGTSVREVMTLLTELKIDAKVVALYISVDRMEKGTCALTATKQIEQEYGIKVFSIAKAIDIIDYLENCSSIENAKEYAKNMRKYLAEYGV